MTAAVNPEAEAIRQGRDRAGLTREQLAVKAGVSRSTVQKMERGVYISRFRLRRIAEALGLDMQQYPLAAAFRRYDR